MNFLFGNKKSFAIEINTSQRTPPFGYSQLWIYEDILGDFSQSMFLGNFLRSLYILSKRDTKILNHIYDKIDEVPSFHDLLSEGAWSWGESFDDFKYVYYIVEETGQIFFEWELRESFLENHGFYPNIHFKKAIFYEDFDKAVGKQSVLILPFFIEAFLGEIKGPGSPGVITPPGVG